MKKLFIEEAFGLAMDGKIKEAFETLFGAYTTGVQGPVDFFRDLIEYLRKTLDVGNY